ncbi:MULTISPECIES: glycosyltransferase [unclassified Moorena]|uniref:glycosyltransferase n=1 Tax=unclassified Moorena TaxID=2683338 RepID=UPI0013FF5C63|nr:MULTISPECIES: glycosyltransferase [unclassified Moorena]NEO11125.1 glycosyltransferase [Moorena sp. SIO3E8]NEP98033.1 glycosyltransferase [Moorena sp. SIO3F7]
MNSKPLVSVITIFLNAEKFIEEAIDSVIAQTYDHWELLLVDDGSTDNSTAIAQRYVEKYPDKVRYLEHQDHENRGMSASRNLGIGNAKGKYIALLDADDIWLPQKLQKQIAILDSHPEAAMVYGNTLYWHSWTGHPEDSQRDYMPELGVQLNTLIQPPTLIKFLIQGGGAVPCPSNFMVKRQIVEEVGGFEETFRGLYEDQVFLAKIFLKTPVFVESGCREKYRQHKDSICYTSQDTKKEYTARRIFLNWLKEYLSKESFKNPKLWSALQKELWRYNHPALQYWKNRIRYFVKPMKKQLKAQLQPIAKLTLPASRYRWLYDIFHGRLPVGSVNFGSLRRITPISREFGYDRGLPIDRYYIEKFLAHRSNDIQGRVLEIGENTYTCRFGADQVTKSDVLHVVEGNPQATFVGDLTNADHIPSEAFDCVILTQTLHLIYDMRTALGTLHRILKPGGVLLVTFPGISQIVKCDWGDDWCWALTSQSAGLLFEELFPKTNVHVETHGNVLAAIAFLQGLAMEELTQKELDYRDREYQVLITVRAVKGEVKS